MGDLWLGYNGSQGIEEGLKKDEAELPEWRRHEPDLKFRWKIRVIFSDTHVCVVIEMISNIMAIFLPSKGNSTRDSSWQISY